MRTTIACQWCRKSKIKCHHEGTAPCRACDAANRPGCVLSAPPITGIKRRRTGHPSIEGSPFASSTRSGAEGHPSGTTSQIDVAARDTLPRTLHNANNYEKNQGNVNYVLAVEKSPDLPELAVLAKACNLFLKLFPEFGFLHRPSFNDQLRAGLIDEVKLCAILAVTARYIPSLTDQFGGVNPTTEHFAQRAREGIMTRVLEKPDPDTVQVLILLGLQDWGSCNSFRSWMYTGMAIRMAQALRAVLDDTSETASANAADTENMISHNTIQECIRRTIWASFVMDCMLGGGKYRPQSFQAARMDLALPCDETNFAFQTEPEHRESYLLRLALSSAAPTDDTERLDCDHSLSLIIRGLDIWSTLSGWICAGGRRLESDSPQSAPWKETSFWHRIKGALLNWRNLTSPRLQFLQDGRNLQAHMSRGQGEPFLFINLLYYLNQMFLHREYIPFLPHRCAFPAGPIDPPLLIEKAPDGWWVANSRILFNAAAQTVNLVRSAQRRGQECRTIFASFSVYTAAATLLYAHSWPHMAPEAVNTFSDYRWALAWLEDVAGIWEMVQGWVETLRTVSELYNRINADKARFPRLGRAELSVLEDKINRFAEVETPIRQNRTPGGDSAAEALLTLAQHGQEAHDQGQPAQNLNLEGGYNDGTSTLSDPNHDQNYSGLSIDNSIYDFAGMMDYGSHSLLASQDLLASIMGDASNDWPHF